MNSELSTVIALFPVFFTDKLTTKKVSFALVGRTVGPTVLATSTLLTRRASEPTPIVSPTILTFSSETDLLSAESFEDDFFSETFSDVSFTVFSDLFPESEALNPIVRKITNPQNQTFL